MILNNLSGCMKFRKRFSVIDVIMDMAPIACLKTSLPSIFKCETVSLCVSACACECECNMLVIVVGKVASD